MTNDLPALLGGKPVRPAGPPAWPPAREDVHAALEQAFADGSWGKYHGPNTKTLTERLAEYHGVPFVELCCSGTAAVELALRAVHVGKGDEVILAAYDFKGNFVNVTALGAQPVLVDLVPENWNLNVDLVASAISVRTLAIVVSHLHGGVVPMRELVELARTHGFAVIEDACQMPGARVQGRQAGTWGDVGVLSFGGSKLLSAGRGGAILTADPQIAQRIRLHCERGNHAYPLSELQAAVLVPQLATLDADNARRSHGVRWLSEQLGSTDGLRPFANSVDASEPGYYKLGLQYDPSAFADLPRDAFVAAVRAEGIALDAGFRALHRTHARSRYRAAGPLPVADAADRNVVVLHHPVLAQGPAELTEITAAIAKVHSHAALIARSLAPETRSDK